MIKSKQKKKEGKRRKKERENTKRKVLLQDNNTDYCLTKNFFDLNIKPVLFVADVGNHFEVA